MIEILEAPNEPNTFFVIVYEYENLICSNMVWLNHKNILLGYNELTDTYDIVDRTLGYLNSDSKNHKYFILG